MDTAAAGHPKVTWLAGTAEATGLASTSVDLVLAAQAFHWFRPPQALVEFDFVPRTPLHALSLAASPARSVRVARFAALARFVRARTMRSVASSPCQSLRNPTTLTTCIANSALGFSSCS